MQWNPPSLLKKSPINQSQTIYVVDTKQYPIKKRIHLKKLDIANPVEEKKWYSSILYFTFYVFLCYRFSKNKNLIIWNYFFFKVAGIVGRADLLCALFFLLSFLGYCKAFKESKHSVCPFSFLLCVFSAFVHFCEV